MATEKPILFSGPMVKAILDDRKTQTRRLVAPQPPCSLSRIEATDVWTYTECEREWKPRYQVGDRLWVREGFATVNRVDYPGIVCDHAGIRYRADGQLLHRTAARRLLEWTGEPPHWQDRWRPSIHMPKWAARIWLEVTDVRCEHVQDISEQDALREGCKHHESAIMSMAIGYRASFIELWDSLHNKVGEHWQDNPWVWVYEFKRIKP